MRTLLVSTLLLFSAQASASDWSLGVVTALSESEYKDQPNQSLILPFVAYQSDSWFFAGKSFGYKFVNSDSFTLAAVAEVDFHYFDPDDADTAVFQAISKRKRGLLGGMQLDYKLTDADTIKTSLLADLSGNHDALLADVSWQHDFDLGLEGTRLSSNVSARSAGRKYAQYYFGINDIEAQQSGLSAYRPGASMAYSVGGTVFQFLTPKWFLLANVSMNYYGNDISDSPLFDDNASLSVFAGVVYRF